MKKPRAFPREQLKFAFVLIVLALIGIVAWWFDPHRARSGESRIPWPSAPSPKS